MNAWGMWLMSLMATCMLHHHERSAMHGILASRQSARSPVNLPAAPMRLDAAPSISHLWRGIYAG
jgi:hypothetical protein